jgi:Transglutaminase-like superfamily
MTGCSDSMLLVWNQIRRFSALPRLARGLFPRACLLLPLISISLRWRRFRKTNASLQHFLSVPYRSQNPDAQARAALTARMVRAVGRHGIGHPNCLKESLAIRWLLARPGIPSDLRLGVRKDGEKFEAHAWVECGGTPLSDLQTKPPHFAAFDAAVASLRPEPQ